MARHKPTRTRRRTPQTSPRRLDLEHLEDRRMLAITWTNRGSAAVDTDFFNATYGVNANVARSVVDQAIANWNSVITDFNFDNDSNPLTNNTFTLNLRAGDLQVGGGINFSGNNFSSPTAAGQTIVQTIAAGKPTAGAMVLDDSAGQDGTGSFNWFFDASPKESTEFAHYLTNFAASATTGAAAGARAIDLLSVVTHEIGHALGIAGNAALAINNFLTPAGIDQVNNANMLSVFFNPAGRFGITVGTTNRGGRHTYEGPVDPAFPATPTHANDLMVPIILTNTRRLISDVDVELLTDAYGYTTVLPAPLLAADAFEPNDTLATATPLGSDAFIHFSDLSIDTPTDHDFFRIVAHDTGKLVVRTFFANAGGDLDLRVLDSSGNVVASSLSTSDGETIIIPAAAQQAYFVEVFGAAGALNAYNLEIESFAAPAPTGVDLDPASDTGASSTDNITGDTTPTFLIQTDVLEFVDADGNGVATAGEIAALTAAQAQSASTPGIAVEVTMVNTTTAQSFSGFADPIIATLPEVYRFTPAAALPAGVYLVTARLRVFDPRQNPPGTASPATGRSTSAPLLSVTINLAAADTLGPQITEVTVNNLTSAQYDVFDPKPTTTGPTPLVTSLRIGVRDLPNRIDNAGTANDFLDVAVNPIVAGAPGNYLLVGDHVGVIGIQSVAVINNTPVGGSPATATIVLNFVAPLPDDRYTLTVRDNLVDPAGNHLDGESNASGPLDNPLFPSGDTIPGGDFVARFTVDSRPEIASYVAQQINVDINGNFVWDPSHAQIGDDATNSDLTFTMQAATGAAGATAPGGFGVHDLVFAGKFFIPPTNDQIVQLRHFDQLAVYGNSQDLSAFRWLIDRNSDGVVNPAQGDVLTIQPVGGLPGNFDVASAIPVAGNFDLNILNGDEIGLYNAGRWALDTNRNFIIDAADTFVTDNLFGHPIVGDFDGDGFDDLAVFNNNTFLFDLRNNGFGGVDQTLIWGFPGVLDRPVAADMDQDGIDDIGLWVPRNNAQNPTAAAEWYFLISDDRIQTDQPVKRVAGTIATLNHPYKPVPFGKDLYAEYGNELALPLVGNFDPPVASVAIAALPPSGDFNSDGTVDGADLLAWQRSASHGSASLGQWQTHFVSAGAPLAVASSPATSDLGVVSANTAGALPTISSATTIPSESALSDDQATPAPIVASAAPQPITTQQTTAHAAAIDAAITGSISHPRSVRTLVLISRARSSTSNQSVQTISAVLRTTAPALSTPQQSKTHSTVALVHRDAALTSSSEAPRLRALRMRT